MASAFEHSFNPSRWRVVLGGFAALLIAGGVGLFSFSVFVVPLADSFGWSRAAISGSAALWAVVFGVSGPLAGMCVDRHGARWTMLAGAAVAGGTYWMMAYVPNLAVFLLLMAISGAGTAACTVVPVQTIVSQEFHRMRGRALGLVMLGLGFGGLVMPPAANALVVHFNWQTAFQVGACLMWLVLMPAIAWTIPARAAGGDRHGSEASRPSEEDGRQPPADGSTLREALRTGAFWQLFMIRALFVFGSAGLGLHFIAWADGQGIASQRAANFFGLAVGVSIVGRIACGWLSDWWNPNRMLAATVAATAASVAVVALIGPHWGPSLTAFAVLYGFGLGGTGLLLTVVVGRCFGMRHFGRILGMVLSGFAPGAVLGPLAAGLIYDWRGSYEAALALFFIAFAACALLALTIRRPWEPSRTTHPGRSEGEHNGNGASAAPANETSRRRPSSFVEAGGRPIVGEQT